MVFQRATIDKLIHNISMVLKLHGVGVERLGKKNSKNAPLGQGGYKDKKVEKH